MRFLVFSDIHSASPQPLLSLVRDYDGVIFLGDGEGVLPLVRQMTDRVYAVRGNCDTGSLLPEREEISVLGNRLLLCHGHRYYAKHTLSVLVSEAASAGCSAVLFGHTHTPCFRYREGICLMNPGAFSGYAPTFGVLDVSNSGIMFSVVDLRSHKILL